MTKEERIKAIEEELLQLKNEKDSQPTESDYLAKLREKVKHFSDVPSFEVGDIVKWKKGLKNRKYPKEDQLCMVIKVLPEDKAKEGEKDSGSPYFGEPLDLVLALLDDEKKDLLLFHYDKRRFEIYKKANEA